MSKAAHLAKVVHLLKKQKDFETFEIVINRGSVDGVKNGDTFIVYGVGQDIQDPESGDSLGQLEIVRGRAMVIHTQEKLATLRCIEKGDAQRKKITRSPSPLVAFRVEPSVTEEEFLTTSLPFQDVEIGDRARMI